MKILFITQSVSQNDGVVSFATDWIEESRKNFSKVTVFALRSSVKEVVTFQSTNKLYTVIKLNYLIIKYRNEYDVIFCHYSALWADVIFITAKLLRKKIYQWWAHGKKNVPLWVNEKVVDKIFTPSQYSNPINNSGKIIYTGHGIRIANKKKIICDKEPNKFDLVSVGRITKVKNTHIIIREFCELLRIDPTTNYTLTLIGPIISTDDKRYLEDAFRSVNFNHREKINIIPNVPNNKIYEVLLRYDGFINAQKDGGEGKAVLEAMSVGLPTFFHTKCYENKIAFKTRNLFEFNLNLYGDLALHIFKYRKLNMSDKEMAISDLIAFSDNNHSLVGLWKKIASVIKK